MLNHHTHITIPNSTDPLRDKITNTFDTSMASPSRQHNFIVRVSHRYIITVAEFGRHRHTYTHTHTHTYIHTHIHTFTHTHIHTHAHGLTQLDLCCYSHHFPPETEIQSTLGFEIRRSRRVRALLDIDDLYSYAYVCWIVSVIRHAGFYAQPAARKREAFFSTRELVW